MALAYWNIVLAGRFRFLDLWCKFLQVGDSVMSACRRWVEQDVQVTNTCLCQLRNMPCFFFVFFFVCVCVCVCVDNCLLMLMLMFLHHLPKNSSWRRNISIALKFTLKCICCLISERAYSVSELCTVSYSIYRYICCLTVKSFLIFFRLM